MKKLWRWIESVASVLFLLVINWCKVIYLLCFSFFKTRDTLFLLTDSPFVVYKSGPAQTLMVKAKPAYSQLTIQFWCELSSTVKGNRYWRVKYWYASWIRLHLLTFQTWKSNLWTRLLNISFSVNLSSHQPAQVCWWVQTCYSIIRLWPSRQSTMIVHVVHRTLWTEPQASQTLWKFVLNLNFMRIYGSKQNLI